MSRLWLVGLLVALSFPASARTWFVSRANVSGVEDGRSWATAFTTINRGVLAAFNDTDFPPNDVWIAEGVYDESRAEQATGSVQLFPGVQMFGGFVGNETNFNQRPADPSVNPTIIIGTGRHTIVAENIMASGNMRPLVDGFTIRGGFGQVLNDMPCLETLAAGIRIRNANPIIQNCIFTNGADFGGSVYLTGMTDPTFENCVFVESRSLRDVQIENDCVMIGGGGSAVFTDDEEAVGGFNNCVFTRSVGGAIRTASSIYITNSYFVGNLDLPDVRGSQEPAAAGIFIEDGVPVVQNSVFVGNETIFFPPPPEQPPVDFGASIRAVGDDTVGFIVVNSTFRNNLSNFGPSSIILEGDALGTMVNSIVWEDAPIGVSSFAPPPDPDNAKGLFTKASANFIFNDIFRGFPGFGNVSLEPRFVRVLRGRWDAVQADPDRSRVTVIDSDANYPPGGLVGRTIRYETTSMDSLLTNPREEFAYIVANTTTSITFYAFVPVLEREPFLFIPFNENFATSLWPQSLDYEIIDFHLRGDSTNVINQGAPSGIVDIESDIDGNARGTIFDPEIDMGADEYNAFFSDTDLDGIVDAADPDADNDGIEDEDDMAPFDAAPFITPPIPNLSTPGIPLFFNLTDHEFDVEDIDLLPITSPDNLPPGFNPEEESIPLRWTATGFDPSIIASQIEPFTDEWLITPMGFGTTPVTLTLTDSSGQTATQTISVTVTNAVPDVGPIPDVEFFEDQQSDEVNLAEFVSDINDTLLTLTIIDSAHIFGDLIGGGFAVFSAAPNFNGQETLTLRVTDPQGDTTEAPIEVRVLPVNDAPSIVPPIPDLILENQTLTLSLTQFESDVEDTGSNLTWSVSDVNTNLFTAAIDVPTDRLVLSRVGLGEGSDDIELTLRDSGGITTSQIVNVSIPITFPLDVSVTPRGSGTVELTPDAERYRAGTIVTLRAEPRAGFRFVRWEGDLGGTQKLKTLDVSGPRRVMAVFEEVFGPPPPSPDDEEGDGEGMGDMEGEGAMEGEGEMEGDGDMDGFKFPNCSGESTSPAGGGGGDAFVMLLMLGLLFRFTRRSGHSPV